MRIRARAIAGAGGAGGVAVHHVATAPGRCTVHLVVDDEAVGLGPMIRSAGPPFMVDRSGPVPRRITAQADQRRGLPSAIDGAGSLLARFREERPDLRAVAVTGCGNLGMNAGVRAVVDGRVLGAPGPEGGAVLVTDGVHGRAAAPEETPPPEGFRIGGPRLVEGGRPAAVRAETFADPRHLLLFPFVLVDRGDRVDFGLTRMLNDAALYADAAAGRPVRLELVEALPAGDAVDAPLREHAVAEARLREALAVKGYAEVAEVRRRGEFRLERGTLEIAYARGIYPHHVLTVDGAGRVGSVLVSGLSNRAGVCLEELAEDLCDAGFVTAVLMDNGGDVGLWRPEEQRFEVAPAEPDRAGRWPLTACFVYSET